MLSPILLYGACALGAVGVMLALPRKTVSPFAIGVLVAAAAFGLALVGLGVSAAQMGAGHLPNIHFYIFSGIALFGALRLITHPRPVYAALYFILTILSSCGLYLILSAEFMAFALVIVYAGAILITYLFVIMLATEGPSADAVEALADYDRAAREPLLATVCGFLLLASLVTILGSGSASLKADPKLALDGQAKLMLMPTRVETILRNARDGVGNPLMKSGDKIARNAQGLPEMKLTGDDRFVKVARAGGNVDTIAATDLPATLKLENVEGVAFSLIGEHPGAIEIAGVILLMAMLGAVVLARKKVEMDDAAKKIAAGRNLVDPALGPASGSGGAA